MGTATGHRGVGCFLTSRASDEGVDAASCFALSLFMQPSLQSRACGIRTTEPVLVLTDTTVATTITFTFVRLISSGDNSRESYEYSHTPIQPCPFNQQSVNQSTISMTSYLRLPSALLSSARTVIGLLRLLQQYVSARPCRKRLKRQHEHGTAVCALIKSLF